MWLPSTWVSWQNSAVWKELIVLWYFDWQTFLWVDVCLLWIKAPFFGLQRLIHIKEPPAPEFELSLVALEFCFLIYWCPVHWCPILQEIVKEREALRDATHGVAKSQTQLSDWTTSACKGQICQVCHYNWEDYFFFLSFTYYLAVLGLARCLQALSHCSEWGLLSSWAAQASRHTAQALGHLGFSSCGAWV